MTLSERLAKHLDTTGECWLWTGYVMPNGYGKIFNPQGSPLLVHRVAYELANGPIPDGLTIDHLCRTRSCVRVEHLEVVPRIVNTRRATASKVQCIHGHPYAAANVYVNPQGRRSCLECRRQSARRYYAAKKQALADGTVA